ncbi:MAG: hypothetical protein OXG05_14410 [Gammaproteobacteria bacterium]|nr:hypothetical protein [Gammaproteobacteria bacterium]
MSIWSVTLTITLSIALTGIIAVSAWAIDDVLDDRRDVQHVRSIALAYRDHMTAFRCTLPATALSVSAVRSTLTGAGQNHPSIEDETNWRMAFDGGNNRQTAVTVFKVDGSSNIVLSDTYTLPLPSGDRTHEFFDAVFDSRICP